MRTRTYFGAGFAIIALAAGAAFIVNYERWIELPPARAKIAAELRDPTGTQFRNDYFTKAGWLCGELNAKNGTGGYAGFRRFISAGRDGDYYLEGEGIIGPQTTSMQTARVLAILDHVRAIADQRGNAIIAQIKAGDYSQTKMPTENEVSELALSAYLKDVFDTKWASTCV